MRIRVLSLALFLALAGHFARGQAITPQAITVVNGCATFDTQGIATLGIQVTGTWSATLQPEVAIGGQAAQNSQVTPSTSTTAQATITANGIYVANVAGYSTFLLCATSFSSGTVNVYLRGSTYINASLLGGGAAGGSPAFNTITGGTNNSAAMVLGNGSSLIETGIGTNSSDQSRWFIGPPQPTITETLTGGSLSNGHTQIIQITLVSAAGETLPGQQCVNNHTSGTGCLATPVCTSGTSCTVIVAAPTIPSGYTGYTVYACDIGTAPCTPTKQTTAPACVNITTSCTLTATVGGGGALPTTTTAYPFPSPLGTNLCSPGTNPFIFVQDVSGTYYPYAGADSSNTGSNPPAPYNKMVFCRPVWFNDTANDPPPGKNAMVLFAHVQNGVTVNINNQDRALYSTTSNCFPNVQTCTDSAAHYALEGIQVEQDIVGTPTINGSPDAEVTAGSFQLSLNTNGTNYSSNSLGTNGVRTSLFRQPGAGSDLAGMSAIFASAANSSTVSAQGGIFAAVRTSVGVGAVGVNIAGAHVYMLAPPATGSFPNGYVGLRQQVNLNSFTPSHAQFASSPQDWWLRNDFYNFDSYLNGKIWINGVSNVDGGGGSALPFTDPITVKGSSQVSQSTASTFGAAACTGGASQYTYQVVGIDGNGGAVSSSTINTPSTCVNPLTVGNPATFTIVLQGLGIVSYNVYRTAGPMGTGRVAVAQTCGTTVEPWINGCNAFTDNGLTATAATAPTVNSTGGLGAVGYSSLAGNKFVVGTSGFTTANNTSLQAITGLIFNLPPIARNYSFSCHGAYSQATALVAVSFGIQAATVAATNIFATGKQQTAAATAPAPSTLATLATTTATNITTGSPAVLATNYTFDLDGTIEEPANDQGNIINIMVSTATGTDAVTVLRGSYCYLY